MSFNFWKQQAAPAHGVPETTICGYIHIIHICDVLIQSTGAVHGLRLPFIKHNSFVDSDSPPGKIAFVAITKLWAKSRLFALEWHTRFHNTCTG